MQEERPMSVTDSDAKTDYDILEPEQSRRLQELYDTQGHRSLTEGEWAEVEGLVSVYGHNLHERQLHELAQKRKVSL